MVIATNKYDSAIGSVAGLPILVPINGAHNAPPSLVQVYLNGLRIDGPGGNVTLVTETRRIDGKDALVVTKVRIAPEAVTGDNAIASVYYADMQEM